MFVFDEDINKKLVFSARIEATNYSSELVIRIKVEQSYFSSMQIDYYGHESDIEDFLENFTILASTTSVNAIYMQRYNEENFNFSLYEKDQNDFEEWEEEYLHYFRNNEIDEDEARRMIKNLIDIFEPEDYDSVENATLKALFEHVKEILNDNSYKIQVKVKDL